MRHVKIVFSVLFVVAVAVLVLRGCLKKETPDTDGVFLGGHAPAKRLVAVRGEARPPTLRPVPRAAPSPRAEAPKPRIAVILDDWGYRYGVFKSALDIKLPMTLSVLPHLAYSRRIAEEAHRNGFGVMLHLPMQPGAQEKRLEPNTIETTMTSARIQAIVDRAVQAVPYATGVNNHMGSAATADTRVMRVLLTHLKKKNLFFVDSVTGRTTASPRVAREVGMDYAVRDVFLDNVLDASAIRRQLERAKQIALSRGYAVAIGHDKKVTLETLKRVMPEFEKEGIQFVLAGELAGERHADAGH